MCRRIIEHYELCPKEHRRIVVEEQCVRVLQRNDPRVSRIKLPWPHLCINHVAQVKGFCADCDAVYGNTYYSVPRRCRRHSAPSVPWGHDTQVLAWAWLLLTRRRRVFTRFW